ncbi:MAG: hypothetical protein LBF40_03880 [Deltaproteobacteria bacterium]|jgi:hypothetical protein|nr:hypothetical protein [Deltaproteobacteria bacterium]
MSEKIKTNKKPAPKKDKACQARPAPKTVAKPAAGDPSLSLDEALAGIFAFLRETNDNRQLFDDPSDFPGQVRLDFEGALERQRALLGDPYNESLEARAWATERLAYVSLYLGDWDMAKALYLDLCGLGPLESGWLPRAGLSFQLARYALGRQKPQEAVAIHRELASLRPAARGRAEGARQKPLVFGGPRAARGRPPQGVRLLPEPSLLARGCARFRPCPNPPFTYLSLDGKEEIRDILAKSAANLLLFLADAKRSADFDNLSLEFEGLLGPDGDQGAYLSSLLARVLLHAREGDPQLADDAYEALRSQGLADDPMGLRAHALAFRILALVKAGYARKALDLMPGWADIEAGPNRARPWILAIRTIAENLMGDPGHGQAMGLIDSIEGGLPAGPGWGLGPEESQTVALELARAKGLSVRFLLQRGELGGAEAERDALLMAIPKRAPSSGFSNHLGETLAIAGSCSLAILSKRADLGDWKDGPWELDFADPRLFCDRAGAEEAWPLVSRLHGMAMVYSRQGEEARAALCLRALSSLAGMLPSGRALAYRDELALLLMGDMVRKGKPWKCPALMGEIRGPMLQGGIAAFRRKAARTLSELCLKAGDPYRGAGFMASSFKDDPPEGERQGLLLNGSNLVTAFLHLGDTASAKALHATLAASLVRPSDRGGAWRILRRSALDMFLEHLALGDRPGAGRILGGACLPAGSPEATDAGRFLGMSDVPPDRRPWGPARAGSLLSEVRKGDALRAFEACGDFAIDLVAPQDAGPWAEALEGLFGLLLGEGDLKSASVLFARLGEGRNKRLRAFSEARVGMGEALVRFLAESGGEGDLAKALGILRVITRTSFTEGSLLAKARASGMLAKAYARAGDADMALKVLDSMGDLPWAPEFLAIRAMAIEGCLAAMPPAPVVAGLLYDTLEGLPATDEVAHWKGMATADLLLSLAESGEGPLAMEFYDTDYGDGRESARKALARLPEEIRTNLVIAIGWLFRAGLKEHDKSEAMHALGRLGDATLPGDMRGFVGTLCALDMIGEDCSFGDAPAIGDALRVFRWLMGLPRDSSSDRWVSKAGHGLVKALEGIGDKKGAGEVRKMLSGLERGRGRAPGPSREISEEALGKSLYHLDKGQLREAVRWQRSIPAKLPNGKPNPDRALALSGIVLAYVNGGKPELAVRHYRDLEDLCLTGKDKGGKAGTDPLFPAGKAVIGALLAEGNLTLAGVLLDTLGDAPNATDPKNSPVVAELKGRYADEVARGLRNGAKDGKTGHGKTRQSDTSGRDHGPAAPSD